MRVRMLTSLALITLLVCSFAQAQVKPAAADVKKEKRAKELEETAVLMINAAVADAASLRLPQNRAIVYAIAGDLLWKHDAKRSRDLFRNAAADIVNYNEESEKEIRESSDPYFTYIAGNIREEVLPLIAKHDSELALEILLQTRSSQLAQAISKASLAPTTSDGSATGYDPERGRALREIALEERFTRLAAGEDVDKLIKAIKDSLAAGISNALLPLLQKLATKDIKKAADLGGDVIKKIEGTDLKENDRDLITAIAFLSYEPRAPRDPKTISFSFPDTQKKDLADKIADTLLLPADTLYISRAISSAMPSLEKYVPAKATLLKQRQAEIQEKLSPEAKNTQRLQKLWGQDATPEQVLAEIGNLRSERERAPYYRSLTSRIGRITDETRAKALIEQIPDDKARAAAAEQFESAKIARVARTGTLDDARRMISNLTTTKAKVQNLVSLATAFYLKGTEANIETAGSLMSDAKALVHESPEDEDELADLMEVVRGYAMVEPDVAFRMFEPIVVQLNDHVQAAATLSKFNKRDRAFKKGEMIMRTRGIGGNNLLLFRYVPQIQLLGQADIERMNTLSDRFQRSDVRTLVKLFAVQGFDRKKTVEPDPGTVDTGGAVISGDL